MSRPSTRGLIFVAVLVGSFCGPQFAAGGLTTAELNRRSKEIEEMTAIERDRLQRNWQTFQALPPDRKEQLRRLHQQIDDDRKNAGGQLYQTLQTYSLWLQTLTPGQRADLRDAKDPAQKLDKVRQIKQEQERQQQSRALNDPAIDIAPWRNRLLRGGKTLNPQELRAAMQALSNELPPPERERLDQFDSSQEKWRAYRRILELSIRQAGGAREWPNHDQQEAIRSAVKVAEPARRLEGIKEETMRRRMFAMLIVNSLRSEMIDDAVPYLPKEDELKSIFEQLDNTERERLMQLPPHRMNEALTRKFYERKKDEPEFWEFFKAQGDLRLLVDRLFLEGQLGGGRFGVPPGDRQPMPRPPGGPNGDGNRRPRDRERPPRGNGELPQ